MHRLDGKREIIVIETLLLHDISLIAKCFSAAGSRSERAPRPLAACQAGP